MNERFDMAVIGGGPAGAFAALRLARQGARVILIDRRSDGEGKTCGHCLNSRCFPLLAQSSILDTIEQASVSRTEELTIHLSDTMRIHSRFTGPLSPPGLIVRRDQFDRILQDAAARAGATLIQGATARILGLAHDRTIEIEVRRRDRTHESRRIRSPLIIGADGIGSNVAAFFTLLGPSGNKERSIGFSFDLHHADLAHLPCESIEMFVHRLGYMGIVREQDSGRAHIGGYIRGRSAHQPNVLPFVQEITKQFQLLNRTFAGGLSRNALTNLSACGPMPFRPRRVSGPHVALIGDASGYVEPFTGEGMSSAIESADLLAQVLTRFNLRWTADAQREYAASWDRQIRAMHNRCRLTGAMIRCALPLVRCGLFGSLPRTVATHMAARISMTRHGASGALAEGYR